MLLSRAPSPWVRRRRIKLAELANESWALPPPESALGSIVTEAFRAAGLEYPRTTVFSFPAEVRTALVATGRFLDNLPIFRIEFSTNRPGLEVLPVDLPVLRMPIEIVTQKNRTLARTPQLFIEHAREVAKQLA